MESSDWIISARYHEPADILYLGPCVENLGIALLSFTTPQLSPAAFFPFRSSCALLLFIMLFPISTGCGSNQGTNVLGEGRVRN